MILVATFKPGTAAASAKACRAPDAASGPALPGASATWWAFPLVPKSGRNLEAIVGDAVVSGDEALVRAAVAQAAAKGSRAVSTVSLRSDSLLAFDRNGAHAMHGALSADRKHIHARTDVDLASEPMARANLFGLSELRWFSFDKLVSAVPIAEMIPLGRLRSAFHVTRDDDTMHVVFDLKEDEATQAVDLAAGMRLIESGVRNHIANEGREGVGAIYRATRAEVADPTHKGPAKLRSFPPVPAAVPKGTRIQTSEADWSAWKPIGFSISEPQRYQYAVVASKDGKNADVIAHGDLNGDGTVSTFRVSFSLDPKAREVSVPQAIDESDPTE